MSPHKLPVLSGKELVKKLQKLGYAPVYQQGSHLRLEKDTAAGKHRVTVPMHKELDRGTLNAIINSVSLAVQTPKKELIKFLSQ